MKSIKTLLQKQLENKSLAHAYLFVGPIGSGKHEIARNFAKQILETKNLVTHPDFQEVIFSRQTGVEEVRSLVAQTALKPFVGSHKVAILDNVNELNAFSANALLKTLEEPSSSTVLILISSNASVMPTVASRCLRLNFNVAKSSEPEPNAYVLHLENLLGESLGERMAAIAEFAELENEQLEAILLAWAEQQKKMLSSEPKRYVIIRKIFETVKGLRASANKKMTLQGLFLSFDYGKN